MRASAAFLIAALLIQPEFAFAKKKRNFTTIAKPRTYKDAKPLPQAVRKPKKFTLLPDKNKKSTSGSNSNQK